MQTAGAKLECTLRPLHNGEVHVHMGTATNTLMQKKVLKKYEN